MGKSIEARFSMIASHTALTNASKSHFSCGKMDYYVVDASAPIRKLTDNSFFMVFDYMCFLFFDDKISEFV